MPVWEAGGGGRKAEELGVLGPEEESPAVPLVVVERGKAGVDTAPAQTVRPRGGGTPMKSPRVTSRRPGALLPLRPRGGLGVRDHALEVLRAALGAVGDLAGRRPSMLRGGCWPTAGRYLTGRCGRTGAGGLRRGSEAGASLVGCAGGVGG